MRIFKKHEFGDVTGWEMGWSPAGRPLMTAYFYIAGSVMIDSGIPHLRSEAVETARAFGIKSMVLTHYHEDHSGNCAAVSKSLTVPVFGHSLTAEKLENGYRILPYQYLMWGKTEPVSVRCLPAALQQDGISLIPVHTPGHSRDHTSYFDPSNGRLFSGDLYLSDRIKYFRADEQIDQQIASLKKVLALDFDTLLCCHRPVASQGKKRIRRKLQYLEDFYGKVAPFAAQAMDAGAIMRHLGLKEQRLIKWLCFGNVSMKNMVRSVIRAEEKKKETSGR